MGCAVRGAFGVRASGWRASFMLNENRRRPNPSHNRHDRPSRRHHVCIVGHARLPRTYRNYAKKTFATPSPGRQHQNAATWNGVVVCNHARPMSLTSISHRNHCRVITAEPHVITVGGAFTRCRCSGWRATRMLVIAAAARGSAWCCGAVALLAEAPRMPVEVGARERGMKGCSDHLPFTSHTHHRHLITTVLNGA